MDDDDVPGWTGPKRRDGLMAMCIGDTWRVISPDRRPMLRGCPCCGAVLRSEKAAKLVANHVYPSHPGEPA